MSEERATYNAGQDRQRPKGRSDSAFFVAQHFARKATDYAFGSYTLKNYAKDCNSLQDMV